jgi:hypothetical protein
MSDALIDELLDELVPAVREPREWDAVVRRARRPRRRAVAAVAVALAVLVFTGISLAEDWFTGQPAPSKVKQEFVRFDKTMQRMDKLGALQGMRQRTPHADASKAYGVLALETKDGPVYLWAAPERGGRPGTCYLLEVYVRPNVRAPTTGGCDDGPQRLRLEASALYGAAFPRGRYLLGRAPEGVLVRVELSDGSRLKLPVYRTFFLAQIPSRTHPVLVDAYDAAGHVVARRRYDTY